MHGMVMLLFAAVAGYWVLERAAGHHGRLNKIGQVVGSIIIIVSFIGVGCKIWHLATGKSGYHKAVGYKCSYLKGAQGQATSN